MKRTERRILIIGWPKAGKTTFAKSLAEREKLVHLCTDSQERCPEGLTGTPNGLGWSEVSQWVSDNWLGREAVIEGVALPRALRKWREEHPGEPPPADRIIVLDRRAPDMKQGQVSMGKGMDTVFAELEDWLSPKIEKISS